MLDTADFILPGLRDLRRVGAHPDFWYPLAWSREVKAGQTYAAQFAGEPIVLVRPKNGQVFALEDRCAHRQVPLSKGVVDGCTLRCCYHGWTYDPRGACIDVPYIGKGKLPNGVRSYPCREKGGLVFIWPGDPTLVTDLPELGLVDDPAYKTRRFGRTVACHYSFMHENLMDMNHHFLHRHQIGQMAPRYLGRRGGPGWLECDYSFARTGGRQPLGVTTILGNWRGRGADSRDQVTIRTQYPYQVLQVRAQGTALAMDMWNAYVPVDAEQRKTRTFGFISVRRPKIPAVLDLAWPLLVWFTERIFDEDSAIVEMEQAAHDSQGADWNQEVFPVIRELRALLRDSGKPLAGAGDRNEG